MTLQVSRYLPIARSLAGRIVRAVEKFVSRLRLYGRGIPPAADFAMPSGPIPLLHT